jgi:hypothetical protein
MVVSVQNVLIQTLLNRHTIQTWCASNKPQPDQNKPSWCLYVRLRMNLQRWGEDRVSGDAACMPC